MSKINLQRGKLTVENRKSREKKTDMLSSRHDMLAIITSRYRPIFYFLLQKLSNYLTADGLRPVAFATSATWLIRHCLELTPDFIRDPTSSTDYFRRLLKTRVTSASSTLEVLYEYALYEYTSAHALTHSI